MERGNTIKKRAGTRAEHWRREAEKIARDVAFEAKHKSKIHCGRARSMIELGYTLLGEARAYGQIAGTEGNHGPLQKQLKHASEAVQKRCHCKGG